MNPKVGYKRNCEHKAGDLPLISQVEQCTNYKDTCFCWLTANVWTIYHLGI